jgi:hypothetical protein
VNKQERIDHVASIITDAYPHRASLAAAASIDNFYQRHFKDLILPVNGKHKGSRSF